MVGVVVTAEDGETVRTYTVTVTRAAPPLSTDATLSELTLSGVTLAFDPATTRYTASVANDVERTTVTATTSDANATYAVQLDGQVDADGTVALAVGENVVTIEVTAEDGKTTHTYTVAVTRAAPPLSTDATLRSLAVSGVTLAFDPANTAYTAQVANDVTETTVTPAVNDGGATYAIQLDGQVDADGTVPLSVGENVVAIVVTAEDGKTTHTYTVTRHPRRADALRRRHAPQPGPQRRHPGLRPGRHRVHRPGRQRRDGNDGNSGGQRRRGDLRRPTGRAG